MSRDAYRSNRNKSGSLRKHNGLASSRSTHGNVQLSSPLYNDPALMINQIASSKVQCDCHLVIAQKEKEIKEMKEKLKISIDGLEKTISQQKNDIRNKKDKIMKLSESYESEIGKLKEVIKSFNDILQQKDAKIVILEDDIVEKEKRAEEMKQELNEQVLKLKHDNEQKLKQLEEKDEEIKKRDDKINVLKSRMAEALGKKSEERQKQLEELKRNLIGAADEARGLQQQLKKVENQECKNCLILMDKLEEKKLQIRLKEKALMEVQNLGKKMQIQLNQQDIILQKWEERDERDKIFKTK